VSVITVEDLLIFDPDIDPVKAGEMIEDATSQALLAAPCLADETKLTETQIKQFKSVFRVAILRWNDQGSAGVVVQTTDVAGSFTHQETVDNRQPRRGLFWPSELDMLEKICGKTRAAGTVDTTPEVDRDSPRGMSVAECVRLGGPGDVRLDGARIN